MSFPDPVLPYEMNALEPHISEKTLDTHVNRHHQGYIDKLNAAIKDTPYADLDLADVVIRAREKKDTAVFRNAAQAWNHDFFWQSLSPNGGNPSGNQFIRQWLGMAGTGQRSSRHYPGLQRGHAARHGCDAFTDARRVGARVLPRLPVGPRRVRRCFPREPDQLGFRGQQP